jgi:hypothetical protein
MEPQTSEVRQAATIRISGDTPTVLTQTFVVLPSPWYNWGDNRCQNVSLNKLN